MNKHEIQQYMSTGMSHEEAIEEILYWKSIESMLKVKNHG